MGNYAWRLNNKHGIAYFEDRKLAAEILKLESEGSRENDAVMATYFSPRGRAFAWQVKFSMENWEQVARALGLKDYEERPVRPAGDRGTRTARKQSKAVKRHAVPQSNRKKRT